MPDTPTPRLGLPRPVDTDTADVPRDFRNVAARLDAIGAAYGQGTIADRDALVAPFSGLFWFSNSPTGDRPQVTVYDGASWRPMVPTDLTGDLSGSTLFEPRVRSIASNSLPIHTSGERRLVREAITLPPGIGNRVIGALDHQGATVAMVVTIRCGSWQGSAKLEWSVAPSASTGWRWLPASAWSGSARSAGDGAISLGGAVIATPYLLERAGRTHIGIAVSTSGVTDPVAVSITLDASGSALAWGPSSEPMSISAPVQWTGGGAVGPPVLGALPTSSYDGQEVSLLLGSGVLPTRRFASQWLPPSAGLRYANATPTAVNFTGLGGSLQSRSAVMTLPWAGDWELSARYIVTGAAAGVVIQLLIGTVGGAIVPAGSVQTVAGREVHGLAGPERVTASAALAPVAIGLYAPGYTASGSYVVPYITARPVSIA